MSNAAQASKAAPAPKAAPASPASPAPRLLAPAAVVSAGPSADNAYDELPYVSHPYSQSHPSRLATVAALFGHAAAPVEKCRVLELGCAAGGNLTPLGELFPESEFVGVDYSSRQIADGERVIRAAGLKNVHLRHASILDVDASYGTFDYIICHGVFSWVPAPVRQKILAICSANLNPNGVAYVSYNTYPGWHLRGMIRDMMRFHSGRFDDARRKVEQARALLDFLARSTKDDTGPYGTLLRQELESLRHKSDNYLYHDHLEEVNDPVYFHQFVDMARQHNLRYLGEARLSTMVTTNFAPEVRQAIAAVATDQIQVEQYLDFVRNRTFRETLLVRLAANPNWTVQPEAVRRLHIAVAKRVADEAVEVGSTAQAKYTSPSGMTLSTSNPILKATMRVLGQRWPATLPFAELHRHVGELLGTPPDDGQPLAAALLNLYVSSNLITFHATPIAAVPVSQRPVALATARAGLACGQGAVNRHHESFRANDLDKRLIPLLDGSRDRNDLLDELMKLVATGELRVQKDGKRLTDPVAVLATLAPDIDAALKRYADACLLKA